jgi:DNA (cytosine-5)-methyltransferase 1
MNYLSVCSGIEAATVAWHHMRWKPVGFSEIEKFPSQVLAHHYPQVTNFGDMTKYKEWKLDDSIGLLVGGTPCQSFSVAGLRKGLDDPRGNLALTYVGILDKFRPKWCVWENVPGVLSSGNGRDFGAFLGALGELGYGWAYRVLDAQNFGVAQRRRRVFVVGCLGNWESAAKVLFESESLSGNIKKGRKSWEETTTAAGISTQLCGPLTARDYKGISSDDCNERYMKMVATPKIANCLETTCNDYSRADGFTMIAYENHPSDSRVKEMGDICQTVTSTWGMGGGNIPFVQNVVGSSEISGTLRANPGSGWRSNGTPVEAVAIQNMAVRRLTEVECERLQGFPDNYTNIKENCPSGVRYKALGNSMAVPVMRWIGERINNYERI